MPCVEHEYREADLSTCSTTTRPEPHRHLSADITSGPTFNNSNVRTLGISFFCIFNNGNHCVRSLPTKHMSVEAYLR